MIVVCHALTANALANDWWADLYGPGRVFDAQKYFIVCANNLGSPYGSSSPKSIDPVSGKRYGLGFPAYTIRDTARLYIALLEDLGISSLHLIIGGSCGGNIAQEMAILLGYQVRHLALLCCSAQETPWVIAIHESQRLALQADPTFVKNEEGAGQAGLRGARGFALPFYRSHASFKLRQQEEDVSKVKDFKASSYIAYQGKKFIERYDAHCYYLQLNALDTHNVARGHTTSANALEQISAKTLCIGFDTDLLIPPIEQKFLARHIPKASFHQIESLFGHDAFLIATEEINQLIIDLISSSFQER